MLTEWDSELFGVGMHLRTITRDGWVCTAYEPGAVHDGTEGELYYLAEDPLQQVQPLGRPGGPGVPRRPVVGPARPPAGRPPAAARAAGPRLSPTRGRLLATAYSATAPRPLSPRASSRSARARDARERIVPIGTSQTSAASP